MIFRQRAARRLRRLAARLAWYQKLRAGLKSEALNELGISRAEAARLAAQGFLPVCKVLYGLDSNDPSEYASDRAREFTASVNGPARYFLDDKLAFNLLMRELDAPTPAVHAYLSHGRLLTLQEAAGRDAEQSLQAHLQAGNRMAIKPQIGGGGNEFMALSAEDGRYRVNDSLVSWNDLLSDLRRRRRDYLFTDYVEQAAYAKKVFPSTTNTMRIQTMRLRDEPEPFIAAAVHRFGTPRSFPVDNWGQGGWNAPIDISTGRVGGAVSWPREPRLPRRSTHPDSGEPMEGIVVPGWANIRDSLLRLAGRMPFLPYIGWDLAVTDDGFTLLEGNNYTEFSVFQVHGPLLRDPRVRAFYRERGIVR